MRVQVDTESFLKRIRQGREFEEWERAQWASDENAGAEFEAPTQLKGKRGRIDIRLLNAQEGHVVIVELKATDWDKMMAHRVRPNVLRHAHQVMRYIETELDVLSHEVTAGLVYPAVPKTPGRKKGIEAILAERGIQVVWRS